MYEIEVLPPLTGTQYETGAEPVEASTNPFALAYANQARFELRAAWEEQRDKWLAAKHRKSAATYRAYADATNRFRTFTGLDWWLITADHVRAWQDAMLDAGLAAATVSQRLAAVSSFYSWVINEQRLGKDGVERSLFFDAHGRTRANPFRANNTERPRPAKTGVSRPISRAVIENLLPDINTGTLEGARDFALLKTFLLTGWRNDEVLKLRWGDLRPNDERPGEYVAAWTGKGQKSDIANVFPAACYHSIVAYLKRAGRYLPGTPAHIQPGDYIWQPIRDHGIANFPNTAGQTAPAAERHISPTQANNILRKHLRHALRKTGLTADEAAQRAATYHIHNLRHTFAHGLKRAKFDVLRISKLMHHSNIAITQRYLDELEEPIDDYSQALQTALGI